MRFALCLALFACFVFAARASAFPGVCLGKDAERRTIRATEIVIMQHAGVSVVTVAVDYEGPLSPFAFVLPVPSDVVAERVLTVKRALFARLDEVSAPRFHLFYEQDPCDASRTEQRWDEHHRALGRGFLAPSELPPQDLNYSVSNEISAAIAPVFKGPENEFRYRRLAFETPAELEAFLAKQGYVISRPVLSALTPHVGPGRALLFAEVDPAQVELVNTKRAELGGIRYWTKQPLSAIPATLGLGNADGTQDLLLYVLDRKARYGPKNYEHAFVPSNLRVEPRAGDQVGRAYAALLQAVIDRGPRFVTEFAWSTRGCGQPCADAPPGLDELMSFGGDVLEAQTTTAKERAGEPAADSDRVRELFEARVKAMPPRERAAERRDHARLLREIGRRRALMARQTYVLSRLRYRYDRQALPRDIQLAPAEPMTAGVGVPLGEAGEISHAPAASRDNEIQVRFIAQKPWAGPSDCRLPTRYRWGKAWASEVRAFRGVPLARDVAATSPDRQTLERLLREPIPELGLAVLDAGPSRPTPAPSASGRTASPSPNGGCSTAPGRSDGRLGLLTLLVFAWVVRAGCSHPKRGVGNRRTDGTGFAARSVCNRHLPNSSSPRAED